MTLRLAFMGTSAFAVPALQRLAAGPHRVVTVYTQPPRAGGRGMALRRTTVHEAAEALGIPVRTPSSLRRPPEVPGELLTLGADLAVVAAYGLILPPPVLAAPRLGCVNLHGSILPRWRGAAPIQRAIMAGDTVTGVSIFQMEAGLDTGPVLAERAVAIGPREDAGTLHDRLAVLAAEMIPGVVEGLAAGTLPAVPQPEAGVTYATKIDKAEARLDLRLDTLTLDRTIRGLTPWPGAYLVRDGERLVMLDAVPVTGSGAPGSVIAAPLVIACGTGALQVTRAQRAGRRPMAAEELARGWHLAPGDRFDLPDPG